MKHLRKFDSVSDMETVLANSTIGIVGLAYNNDTPVIEIKTGGTPGPDYSEPFYIEDVSGMSNTVQIVKSASNAPTLTIEKSSDGVNWESMGTTSATVKATIPANGKLYLRCNTTGWSTTSGSPIKYHSMYANRNFNIGGNIMSLLYGDNFTGDEIAFPAESSHNFYGLFYGATTLISAANLLLPATTLTRNCYNMMFSGCTSLTTAPELPATTLAYRCYATLFNGCSNLNYIKCLATNISASGCLMTWVSGVASSGTFVKNPSMSSWTEGVAGIPEGWTVQDATE